MMPSTSPADEPENDELSGPRATRTRDRILRAAAQQFASRGFDGTKFREVGQIAGVSFQSIRYHFGAKEQLWEAVVDHLADEARNAALNHEQALAGLPPQHQLRAQVRALVAYTAANTLLQRILLREAMKPSERYEKAFDRHVRPMESDSAAFLGRLQEHGVIKPDLDLRDLFYVFHGAIIYRLVAPPGEDLDDDTGMIREEIIDQHTDTICRLLMVE